MAHTEFVEYLSYNTGDLVSYRGVAFVFVTNHAPGPWDGSQVVQVNQRVSYTSADFNTLPDYNLSSPLPPAKFRVLYDLNNDDFNIEGSVADNRVYLPGEEATILGYPYEGFSSDGLWVYTFSGWSLNKGIGSSTDFTEGLSYVMPATDLRLYAQWTKEPTVTVDADGTLKLKAIYKDKINTMIVPEYFGGSRIKIIGTDAFSDSSISEIILPASIKEVEAGAFDNWAGTTLRFIDADVTVKYPLLKLSAGCFKNTPNLRSIILPYRWQEADGILFPVVQYKELSIYIRNTKDYMEELIAPDLESFDVEAYIAAPSALALNYSRTIYWGYNE